MLSFLERYQQAKRGPRLWRQVNPLVKGWVWAIREREAGCCGQKIAYFLEREYGVHLSVPKIYEILREKYVIRSKWKKNHLRGPLAVGTGPREVVQMGTIMFGGLFAFTGIDIYTKEADILVAPALTAAYGCAFLEQSMTRRFDGAVGLVQTDGGSGSKRPSQSGCWPTANDIGWPGHTRRTSKLTSRALIGRYEKSAWAGHTIALSASHSARVWWSNSWSATTTTALT